MARELTVVAVTPPGFQGTVLGLEFDLWVPAGLAPILYDGSRELEARNQRGYSVMGRLLPGTSQALAQADVDAVAARIEGDFPEANAGFPERGPSVLARTQGSPTIRITWADSSSGRHASPAAGCLRQHGESCPGASNRSAA